MPLTIYRRHNAKTCIVHTLPLGPREKRHYMDCQCPLWMTGHTDSISVPRQSLGTSDLRVAEAKRRNLLADSAEEKVRGISLKDAIRQFMDTQAVSVGEATLGHYELLLRRLTDYCTARGITHMSDLSVNLLENFQATGLPPKLADISRARMCGNLRTFLLAAHRREWIEKPLGDRIQRFRADHVQRDPFTEQEVQQILDTAEAAAPASVGPTRAYQNPHTFRLLLDLMLETGMRVSDAVRFDPSKLRMGATGVWVYGFQQVKRKRGSQAVSEVFISERLKSAIDNCEWTRPGEKPFWVYTGSRLEGLVRNMMKTIGESAGVTDAHPHRLRHTFAKRMLLRGVAMGDLSKLLGHAHVGLTETYYAKWVPERASRLEGIAAQAIMNTQGNALGY